MNKLVILKLGQGSFEEGFPVTMRMCEGNLRLLTEMDGVLPKFPQVLHDYQQWQKTYRNVCHRSARGRLQAVTGQVTNVSFEGLERQLRSSLNIWLESASFRPLWEKLLEKLNPTDEIRVVIQTNNEYLRRLPWHLWRFFDSYRYAEVALSPPAYEVVNSSAIDNNLVRVLVILGDSRGISVEADRKFLEKLPNAETLFLVEPKREEINDQLWEQGWDILFFAGHSRSSEQAETGELYLNPTDSLSMTQLKYALTKAIAGGLQLAIFNSCDGLGIAWELAELQIPQVIVMREPVPDCVAQLFLKYFLRSYSQGKSLYTAVREARERLHGLEERFPYASWLPVICQNPGVVPKSWQELYRIETSQSISKKECLSRRVVTIKIPGNLDELEPQQIEKITAILKKVSGDVTLEFLGSKRGSIILSFEGSEEGVKRIQQLFESGQLTKLLNTSIEDVTIEPVVISDDNSLSLSKRRINLSQWLENHFEQAIAFGWQTIDNVLGTRQLAFRSEAKKLAKRISLGKGWGDGALVIELTGVENQEVRVLIRVYPLNPQSYLPPSLKLIVVPEIGESLEITAGQNDSYLEQEWFFELSEEFAITIALSNKSFTEKFAI